MKSLIWQSVMWRPGKARFLIDMKNPLPIRPAPTARQHGPLRGRAVRQIRDVSRATPSLRHASGDTFSSRLTRASHPDRRAADQHQPDTASRHSPPTPSWNGAEQPWSIGPSPLLRIAKMHTPRSINLTPSDPLATVRMRASFFRSLVDLANDMTGAAIISTAGNLGNSAAPLFRA